jgi:hypothetical protein
MITVDITTRNTVYNSLGPQGQWIQHRFGKRNYPLVDLDLQTIEKIIVCNETVFFRSIYGDPLCHPDIDQVLDIIAHSKCNVFFFSFLNVSDAIISKINSIPNIHVYCMVDGYTNYGKTILDSNKKRVFKNLSKLSNATVEYRIYRHNVCDIKRLEKAFPNAKVVLLPGIKLIADFSTVIDKDGNWLHDVFSLDTADENSYDPSLNKTIDGYKVLVNYLVDIEGGVSILEQPLLSKFIRTNKTFQYDMDAVSVTGHIFPSTELMTVFSNALCTDWKIVDFGIDLSSSYQVEINTVLLKILEDGLKSFSDSNV